MGEILCVEVAANMGKQMKAIEAIEKGITLKEKASTDRSIHTKANQQDLLTLHGWEGHKARKDQSDFAGVIIQIEHQFIWPIYCNLDWNV